MLFYALALIAFEAAAQNRLLVRIHDVPGGKGLVRVAVYDSGEHFLSYEAVVMSGSVEASETPAELLLEGLPSGTYALALFHDENRNGKLDKNFLGIPKEPIAFSNARLRTFGPPKFEDCRFDVQQDTEIDVSF